MNYALLSKQLEALSDGIEYDITVLANASALLYSSLDDINWAGFYVLKGGKLRLSAFQGKPACTVIEIGRGVCGKCAKEMKTVRVDNVHEFEGHIACDCTSNSEIVIPIIKDGALYGVLDIDSPIFSRFDDEDKEGLEDFVKALEKHI